LPAAAGVNVNGRLAGEVLWRGVRRGGADIRIEARTHV